MNSMLQSLTQDHKHLIELLYRLEREVKACSGLGTKEPDLNAVLNILDYIKVYPQIRHRPMEDIIYETLLDKDVPNPGLFADLMEEHGVLSMLVDYLHQIVDAISKGRDESAARLVKKTSELIQRQLNHIKQEQDECFPLINQLLTGEDWEKIHQRFEVQINTTDEVKWQEYKLLYRDIVDSDIVDSDIVDSSVVTPH